MEQGEMNLKQAVEELWPMLRTANPALPPYEAATKEQLSIAHMCYGAGFFAAGGGAGVANNLALLKPK
jgi:hypothetical protein